jgi:hypothetical protein
MYGSAFRVCGDTCTLVTTEISALKLHKNEDGGYAYDDALIFKKKSSEYSNANTTKAPVMA